MISIYPVTLNSMLFLAQYLEVSSNMTCEGLYCCGAVVDCIGDEHSLYVTIRFEGRKRSLILIGIVHIAELIIVEVEVLNGWRKNEGNPCHALPIIRTQTKGLHGRDEG